MKLQQSLMIAAIDKALTSRWLQNRVNQNRMGRVLGYLADSAYIPNYILHKIIHAFIKNYHIDMQEYDFEIASARCFNAFFSRPLKAGQRPQQAGITSPVDGRLTQYQPLNQGDMLQVKGKHFTLQNLIRETPQFLDGHYAVIYLSPGDYHRFHAPFDLLLQKIHYIPGSLLATSSASLERQEHVYCRNERIVLSGHSAWGKFYLVAVGATAVGRICLSHHNLQTNQRFANETVITENLPQSIRKGEELGYFQLGSTVVLAIGNTALTSTPHNPPSPHIKMGTTLWS